MASSVCSHIDQTLSKFLSQYVVAVDLKRFLDTKDPITKATNWEKVKRKYNEDELNQNESKYPSGDVLVKAGTNLLMFTSYLERDIPNRFNTKFQNTSFKPFIAREIKKLFQDPKYTKSIKSYLGEEVGSITDNDVTVYIWSKALNQWINVSAFVVAIQTTVNENGGQFSISLAPFIAQFNEKWEISSDIVGYDTGSVRDNILAISSILKNNPKGKSYLRNSIFPNVAFQNNDLVYIRFEKLSIDEELDTQLRTVNGSISPQDIPNRIYDMIGLVDVVSMATSPNNINVGIVGRDLSKILVEDGSYFFVTQFAQNIFTDDDGLLSKRNRAELEALSFSAIGYTFKSVETILKFIFNKFSNIGWVDNDALNGYGGDLLKQKYSLKTSSLSRKSQEVIDVLNKTFLSEPRQGVWRICDLVFDPQVAQRVLADNSIYRDAGSIINSIRRICQQPFIEFYGDTYGDTYRFIVRKTPWDREGYIGSVYGNFVSQPDAGNSIIKTSKLIVTRDAGPNIGMDILDFPLSLDDDRVKKRIRQRIEDERSQSGREAILSDMVIDIDDVNVIGDQLTYHNEAYAWYRIIPRGLGVVDEESEFLFAPAVAFDQYAKIFGNKSYELEYNYAPVEYLRDSQSEARNSYAEAQVFYDLQYLIQCNQYLPFTRRGVISITGDRRIKRGLFVYYRPTNEVFYVDSVTHAKGVSNNSNERTTTLQVSRGMKEPYIKGKLVKFASGEKRVSYFDIINTSIASNASINNAEFLKNWKVDDDVMNFFVQRKQWADA